MYKFVLSIFILLFSALFLYAEETPSALPQSSAAKLIETTNQRLNQQVEELTVERDTLKSEKISLEGQVNAMMRDKDNAIEQLKKITNESASLKTQIATLDADVADLEKKRNLALEENVKISESAKAIESKYQLEINLDKEKNKYKNEAQKLEKNFNSVQKDKLNLEEKIAKLQGALINLQQEKALYLEDNSDLKRRVRTASIQFTEAARKLEKMDRDSADMHYNLGVIYQRASSWDKAIAEYNRVLDINPADADAHYNLALIYETVKNKRDKAIFHYECYLSLNPDASDIPTVKKRITDIKSLKGVWGEPYLKAMYEKEVTGRAE